MNKTITKIKIFFILTILCAFAYGKIKDQRNKSYPLLKGSFFESPKESLKRTKYFYSACGDVIMVDRTESQKKQSYDRPIKYYVTYHNEYTNEHETLKVTPNTYKRCKDGQKRVCFSKKDKIYNEEKVSYEWMTIAYGAFFLLAWIFIYKIIVQLP